MTAFFSRLPLGGDKIGESKEKGRPAALLALHPDVAPVASTISRNRCPCKFYNPLTSLFHNKSLLLKALARMSIQVQNFIQGRFAANGDGLQDRFGGTIQGAGSATSAGQTIPLSVSRSQVKGLPGCLSGTPLKIFGRCNSRPFWPEGRAPLSPGREPKREAFRTKTF
jgi:hypothetical protein